MKKEKVDNEKRNHRKSQRKMFTYEMGRRLTSWIPFQDVFFKTTKKKRKIKRLIFIWGLLAVPIVHWLVFWLYANANSILLAFKNIDFGNGGREYWTLNNFAEVYKMFSEGNAAQEMLHYGANTFKFWILAIILGIPWSLFITYLFHKKMLGSKVFRVLLYLPSIINAVAFAGMFEAFAGGNGSAGYILKEYFGMKRVPSWFQEDEYAIYALLFFNLFTGFSGNLVLYSGAIANVDNEVTEAAYMDGVTMWQEIRHIIIPMMWPTISMTIITSFAGLFGASGPILLFTQSLHSTWTWGYWIFDQVRLYNNYYVPAALGLCFTIVAFPIAMFIKHTMEKLYTTE